ncbi:THUMP-like domain-containing protein [Nocardia transvalensis]|uniref:THUMP-like domain-containing protein n=1 Tax=Nocardia transvalensis TaxID=37333 RepID=UPI001895775B|nr:class I SAM-dependent methyltransferase [Nocardia transvalensis]MBF6332932.1 class I SAM-dependent methyltransferase [Nocardia transvalensis]
MAYRFSRDDVAYLGSAAGEAALAEVDRLALTSATLVRDLDRVRREHGERAGALVETVRLRRRAGTKLAAAGEWLFTDDALQQATPSAVARHRAARLAGRAVHDVTCSIGAEIAELHRVCPAVIGSDLDAVRLAMAAHNLAGARNVLLAQADALKPCSTETVVIADPARRADGRRTYDPAKLQPPLPDLIEAYWGRELVVKCAPGLDFDSMAREGEVEVVSLDGSVREACLWPAGLAALGVTRRASVLSSDGTSWTITDAEPDEIPDREPGQWIIDPDGAVVRAGLVRHYAAKHGLWQLDPRIAYLTGDRVPDGVRGFRILDRLDFREKPLRAELHRRHCGPLEILTRGVDLDPDALRTRLKPRGTTPHTLIITRIGRTPTAFLCETPPAT